MPAEPLDRPTAPARERVYLLGVFAAACLVVVSRRPDAVFHPQFYMEDGSLWYAQAHEAGWLHALFVPARGYFQTSARLGAALAMAVPLVRAPLVMAAVAILVEALPAVVIASSRFARAIPDRRARLLLALLSACLPGAWTTIANLTHAQWYLSIAALLVVVCAPPVGRAGEAFDGAVLALSGLSGPFAIFLAPVSALAWLARRERWTLVRTGVLGACAVVQAIAIPLASETSMLDVRLGASAPRLAGLIARQIVLAGLLGERTVTALAADPASAFVGTAAAVAIVVVFVALLAIALVYAPLELRLMALFSALSVVAALVYPPVPGAWWELLQNPGFANRYFIAPILTCATLLVWALGRRPLAARVAGGVGLATMLAFGVRVDWRQPALPDYDFAASAAKYERAEPGQTVQIPFPPGWVMVLTKR
jgi:hypothetical protein